MTLISIASRGLLGWGGGGGPGGITYVPICVDPPTIISTVLKPGMDSDFPADADGPMVATATLKPSMGSDFPPDPVVDPKSIKPVMKGDEI